MEGVFLSKFGLKYFKMNLRSYLRDSKKKIIRVIVKPNKQDYSIEYSKESDTFTISLKEPANKGKANKVLLKFLKKETGLKPLIKKGKTSKEKLILFS
jgi:uncharacterized protein (TIGR00251 family)